MHGFDIRNFSVRVTNGTSTVFNCIVIALLSLILASTIIIIVVTMFQEPKPRTFSLIEVKSRAVGAYYDCDEVKDAHEILSLKFEAGIYEIRIAGEKVPVWCTRDGFTVIQARGQFANPKDMFYKLWDEYVKGFGTPGKEFWLGLNNMYFMTRAKNYSLKIEATDTNGTSGIGFWDLFRITENTAYKLHVGGYSAEKSTLGKDPMAYSNGKPFSTRDRDQDSHELLNCAAKFRSGWWYNACHEIHLNGLNLASTEAPYGVGITITGWRGLYHSLKSVRMSVKPAT